MPDESSKLATTLNLGILADGPMPVVVSAVSWVDEPIAVVYIDAGKLRLDEPQPTPLRRFAVSLEGGDDGNYFFGEFPKERTEPALPGAIPTLHDDLVSDQTIGSALRLVEARHFTGERVEIHVPVART